MFTIEQISERTGMSIHVLRKYINRLKPYLEPYIARGENNRIFFTAPGLIVFDNIKQFKEQGMALPSIKKELDKLSGPDVQSGSQSVESVPKEEKPSVSKGIAKVEKGGSPNPPNDQTEHEYLKKLLETHEQLTLEKEKRNQDMSKHVETISNLQNELNNAKDQLRLLPEGKSPEQVRKELEAEASKKEEYKKLLSQLEKTGALRVLKRKKLIKELKEIIG